MNIKKNGKFLLAVKLLSRGFGWSDISKADAKRHAKQRVDEAFKKLADGHEVERRELRVSL